jgi:hypothetical protein
LDGQLVIQSRRDEAPPLIQTLGDALMISVSSASKGDILIEPIELLIELLIRFFGKALSRTYPADPLSNGGGCSGCG